MTEYIDTPNAVGWGTIALLTAGIAQSKNRSGLLWFIAAMFFGPIATFLLVAACNKVEEKPPEAF